MNYNGLLWLWSLQGIDLDFLFICKSLNILLMQEITHLYLLLSLLCVVCSPRTHTSLRDQSLLQHFAHSHCILQIAGTLPSLPCLSEIALNDELWVFFLIIHTSRHWSKSRSILKTTYLMILFHQIGLNQYLNFRISNCFRCRGCTDLF